MNTLESKDLTIMRKAVREEYADPHSRWNRPDWQSAITDYLQSGGTDGEVGDLQQLFREACEEEGLEY